MVIGETIGWKAHPTEASEDTITTAGVAVLFERRDGCDQMSSSEVATLPPSRWVNTGWVRRGPPLQ